MQQEFRTLYRSPYNKNVREVVGGQSTGRNQAVQAFFHWRQLLTETFLKLNRVISEEEQPQMLFHGVNRVMPIDNFSGTNFGPSSTTADLRVARSFAGKNGMILVLRPKSSRYRVVDISWSNDYPDEKEYLIFDHNVEIESVVLSCDYDRLARIQAPSGLTTMMYVARSSAGNGVLLLGLGRGASHYFLQMISDLCTTDCLYAKEHYIFDHEIEIENVLLLLETSYGALGTPKSVPKSATHVSYVYMLVKSSEVSLIDFNVTRWLIDVANNGLQQMYEELVNYIKYNDFTCVNLPSDTIHLSNDDIQIDADAISYCNVN